MIAGFQSLLMITLFTRYLSVRLSLGSQLEDRAAPSPLTIRRSAGAPTFFKVLAKAALKLFNGYGFIATNAK